jgi:hypothetical protein
MPLPALDEILTRALLIVSGQEATGVLLQVAKEIVFPDAVAVAVITSPDVSGGEMLLLVHEPAFTVVVPESATPFL